MSVPARPFLSLLSLSFAPAGLTQALAIVNTRAGEFETGRGGGVWRGFSSGGVAPALGQLASGTRPRLEGGNRETYLFFFVVWYRMCVKDVHPRCPGRTANGYNGHLTESGGTRERVRVRFNTTVRWSVRVRCSASVALRRDGALLSRTRGLTPVPCGDVARGSIDAFSDPGGPRVLGTCLVTPPDRPCLILVQNLVRRAVVEDAVA